MTPSRPLTRSLTPSSGNRLGAMPQVSSSEHPYDDADDAPAPTPGGAPQAQVAAVDALLDEIDVTLQQNAEQFVRSFVQKGGE